jgi:hypothetical protein
MGMDQERHAHRGDVCPPPPFFFFFCTPKGAGVCDGRGHKNGCGHTGGVEVPLPPFVWGCHANGTPQEWAPLTLLPASMHSQRGRVNVAAHNPRTSHEPGRAGGHRVGTPLNPASGAPPPALQAG